MKIQEAEQIVCYDVDDTLVKWDRYGDNTTEGKIRIEDPYNKCVFYLEPHARHIALLKSHKARGNYVKVWSAAGWQWAKIVVETLGLEQYVDAIETKPQTLVDDLPSEQIFPQRIYLKDI